MWIQWCTQDKYAIEKVDGLKQIYAFEIDGLTQISIWKLMDSSKLASKIDGLTQFFAFESDGLKQISIQNWWTQAKYAFAN